MAGIIHWRKFTFSFAKLILPALSFGLRIILLTNITCQQIISYITDTLNVKHLCACQDDFIIIKIIFMTYYPKWPSKQLNLPWILHKWQAEYSGDPNYGTTGLLDYRLPASLLPDNSPVFSIQAMTWILKKGCMITIQLIKYFLRYSSHALNTRPFGDRTTLNYLNT